MKLVDKLNTKNAQNDITDYISVDKWVEHFQGLLLSKVKRPFPEDIKSGPLDHTICEVELFHALKTLKSGKSPGLDNITNEILTLQFQSTLKLF